MKRVTLLLALMTFATAQAGEPRAPAIRVGAMSGPVSRAELRAFADHVAALRPATSNEGNAWVQGSNRPMSVSGEDLKAIVRVLALTRRAGLPVEPGLKTAIGTFCAALLAQRNDLAPPPLGQRRDADGLMPPVWPNRLDSSPVAADAGLGDIVGHLADCAITLGPAQGRRFLAAADQTADLLERRLLAPRRDLRFYFRADSPVKPGEPVPWNQITMLEHGFASLAQAHRQAAITGPIGWRWDQARARRYDRMVRANIGWFTAEAERRGGGDRLDWGYQAEAEASEDGDHAGLDFDGLWNAYRHGRYGVRERTMRKAATTLFDTMVQAKPMRVAGRVNGASGPLLNPDGSINKRTAPMPFVRSGYIMMGVWRPSAYDRLRDAFMASFADPQGLLGEMPPSSDGARIVSEKPLALSAYAAMLDLRACLFGVRTHAATTVALACT